MEIKEIIKLIEAVSNRGLTEFELEENGFRLSMKKEKEVVTVSAPAFQPIPMQSPSLVLQNDTAVSEMEKENKDEESEGIIDSDKVVTSPLVGTFYAAPSPDTEDFVKIGDVVKKGQVLGIIEAMKLMNEIESEHDGVVEAVLVKNEEIVEYGQPLFRIK